MSDGARVTKEPLPGTRTDEGDQVQAYRFEVLRARDLPLLVDVVASLQKRGFRIEENVRSFVTLRNEGIKASITAGDAVPDKVVELELEFVCSATSISDLPRWCTMANSLADEFNLLPMNLSLLVAFEGANEAIRSTRTWMEFSDRYGWGRT
jgi:hypothetical protein